MEDILYYKKDKCLFFKKIFSKEDISLKDAHDGYTIIASEKVTRSIIESLRAKKSKKILAVQGGNDAFNRRVLETLSIQYIISPEEKTSPDTLKHRDSGINHVTAKIAKKKGIIFLINTSEVKHLPKKEQAKRIAKIIQNVLIVRRAKAEVKIVSLAEKKEDCLDKKARFALGISWKMSTKEASEAVRL